MPLISLQPSIPESRLCLWHTTESKEELSDFLLKQKREDLLTPEHFTSEKRNYEWLATRNAITMMVDGKAGITYDERGKPHLINHNGHLSISHSWPYVALFYHPHLSAGVDIEKMTERIKNIRPKFINAEEEKWLQNVDEIKGLYLVWAAKEAVFKMIGGGGILFREHLEMKPVYITEKGSGIITYSKEKKSENFVVYYEFLDGMILVYTIANDTLL
jgi:4'-phosphopantetheinyl transferase